MLYQKNKSQLKEAMVNKDVTKRDVLKMVVNKARSIMKQNSPNEVSEDITDDVMISAIEKELKQLNQTKESLKDKTDCKLYSDTENKILILKAFLPEKMSRNDIENVVNDILSKNDCTSFGDKMKVVMAELKGKADGKLVKEVIQSLT